MNAKRDSYAEGLALAAVNRHAEAIERYEAALQERPGDIRVLFALGNTASALGMARPVETFFREVLAQEPERIEALVNLDNLLRAQGQFSEAEAILAPALARNPRSPELWLTLGSVYREQGDDARAAAHYREALGLRPDYPAALGNLADILGDDGEVAEALALYERVLTLDPGNAQAKLNRAVLHLLTGRLREGWRDYAARLDIPGKAPRSDRDVPRWRGESLRETRLLVTAEQGIGDQIMFASCLPDLAARAEREGGTLFVECEHRLVPLFARSFPGVAIRASRIETRGGVSTAYHIWLDAEGGATAAIEIGSLPRLLRGDIGRFPMSHRYLVPDEGEVARWRETLGAAGFGPFVGVCWRSGASGGGRATQYAPLSDWAEFLRRFSGTAVCVQYGATSEELGALERMSGRRVFVPPALDQKSELDRTCAMLAALDAVVSAPTAVSWLGAAVGVPTAKILYDTSWTSFSQTYEPFAPACVLMMPERRSDWTDTFAKAARWLSLRSARV